jgi:hypothetical protein
MYLRWRSHYMILTRTSGESANPFKTELLSALTESGLFTLGKSSLFLVQKQFYIKKSGCVEKTCDGNSQSKKITEDWYYNY